ncbi:acetolactate synthase 3 regulatory subunit [Citrobacter koseri]|uniref:Acetolactate synthase 3 regulatory subunit n=1 Tax=Citrobacter koseri TaxID=545 RepID=A0A2X2XK83_CITKO|nr:acetolactate synthase 3 regulatory subunit [Citrobacter koseri]
MGRLLMSRLPIYTVQLAGTSDKLDAFLATLREVAKIVEVARSGVVGLSRGRQDHALVIVLSFNCRPDKRSAIRPLYPAGWR